jgi:hypothetical protein
MEILRQFVEEASDDVAQTSIQVLGETIKDTPGVYPKVPCVMHREAKTDYCPAPVFSPGFSAGFLGVAATEVPALGFQNSSALIHSGGT